MSILSIRWVPKDALDGMQVLDAMEELAYRRIIDLIYVTEDNLEDDDKKLAWMTKTGKQWKRIKETLLRLGKIEITDSKIRNRKCSFTIHETRGYIEQQSIKGKASAEKRKQQKNNDTGSTAVITKQSTEHITDASTEPSTEGQVASSLKEAKLKTSTSLPVSAKDEVFKNGKGMKFDVNLHLSDDGRQQARQAAPGWDLYHLASIFNENVNTGKLQPPHSPERAFAGWCASYTKGKPP